MTVYNLFMHYYNDDIGQAVTNSTEAKWFPCDTLNGQYPNENAPYYKHSKDPRISKLHPNHYLTLDNVDKSKFQKGAEKECLEILYISPSDTTDADFNTNRYEEMIVANSQIFNPKYDMIFVWDGLGFYTSDTPSVKTVSGKTEYQYDDNYNDPDDDDDGKTYRIPKDPETNNQLYYDKMKRVSFQPWFFHSKYHSLNAVITKASQLVDLYGKEHVLIGKEVALDQYIDIV